MPRVIVGLAVATAGFWLLCAILLSAQGAGGWSRGLLCLAGVVALIAGTQFAASFALPSEPAWPMPYGYGDPSTRKECALRATVPYFKRAVCTSVSVSVATAFVVRWLELQFGWPAFLYWIVVVPILAALYLSVRRVQAKIRPF